MRGRREEPIDPANGAAAQLAEELRSLRKRSELTVRELAQRAHCSVGAVSSAQSGRVLPSWAITRAIVAACGEDPAQWQGRWAIASAGTEPGERAAPVPAAAEDRAAGIRDAPVIESITSPEEFHSSLRALRAHRGNPSLRELCASAGKAGHVIARSTLADALRRTGRLPSMEIVEGLLAAYEVPAPERDVWRWAWSRVAYLQQRVSDPPSPRWRGQCPWPGLAAYDEDTADVFYGREQLITRLVARLAALPGRTGMVAVVGASGSGKSSLLRAGLVPAITAGRLSPEPGECPYFVMTPSQAPLDELTARLAEVPSGRFVLVIDQFEELFVGAADDSERAALIDTLVSLAGPGGAGGMTPRAIVVLGLRSDFFHLCADYPALSAVLEHPFLVDPMTDAELRAAVTGPASAAGLALEPGLCDLILSDLRSSPRGSTVLPLLSHALRQAWEHREGDVMTCQSYATAGGLITGIQASAEEAYTALSPARRATARKLLIRMVGVNRDGVTVRRRVRLGDVDVFDAGQEVLLEFAAARLVMIDQDTAEITHEAILRAWPRLSGWIDEEHARIRAYCNADEAARAWQEAGRDRAFLYRGSRLANLHDALRESADLPPVVREFHTASRRAARRWRIAGRAVIAALALLTIATTLTAVLAVQQRDQAQADRILAAARGAAIESQSVPDPVLATELAATAYKLDPGDAARSGTSTALASATERQISAGGPVNGITFSQDGRTLDVFTAGTAVEEWNIAGQANPQHIRNSTVALSDWYFSSRQVKVTLTGDSRAVPEVVPVPLPASRQKDSTRTVVVLWEIPGPGISGTSSSHPDQYTIDLEEDLGKESGTRFVWGVPSDGHPTAISTDGRMTALAVNGFGIKIFGPGGTMIGQVPLSRTVSSISFSPDGKQLAAITGSTVYLWNLADLTSPQAFLRDACAQGRQLSPQQWSHYIPEIPYKNICQP